MECVLNKVIDTILSPVLESAAKHTKYLLNAGDAVQSLEEATTRLEDRRDDVKKKIKDAERKGLEPTHVVQGWLKEVNHEIQTEVPIIVERYNKRSLCLGDFSLDCWCLYSTGANASKKLKIVHELYNRGFEDVVVKLQSSPTSKPSLDSEDPNLQLALHYLKDDEVGMVGIWGMGGVGKTHLLKRINNSIIRDSTFDTVISVTASKECLVAKIQHEIVKKLELTPLDDHVESQAYTIFKFLKERSFLLLLDDLWERLDLEEVGIPFPLGVDSRLINRKVVITTRSAEVCGLMEVRMRLKVECLNEEDAWMLFVEKVTNETINSDPLIPGLARQVVKELDGLPLALITIGRSMYTKKDPREWEDAICLLKNSRLHEVDVQGKQDGAFHKLKFSYDSLRSDVLKKCFLSCALWPEDFGIGKNGLIRCWIGLGLIDKSDMREAYNAGYALIGRLQDVSLLEEYGYMQVRMHDVFRDMALWIACDCGNSRNKWVVHARVGLQETKWREDWLEAERISLSHNDLDQLPTPNAPRPNKLTTLMLMENKLSTLENVSIFTSLAYLDLSFNCLDHFPIEICKLIKLQYLNLSYNDIRLLPEELGSLIDLKHLLLRNCRVHTFPEGVIAQLKSLRELDFYAPHEKFPEQYHPPWLMEELEGLHNLSALGINVEQQSQLDRLYELSNVSILRVAINGMNNSTIRSLSTNFLRRRRIQTRLTELLMTCSSTEEIVFESPLQNPNWHLCYLEILQLFKLDRLKDIIWRGLPPKDLFQRLQLIFLGDCCVLENMSWVTYLPRLKQLAVVSCNNMKELVKIAREEEDCSKHVESIEEERDQMSAPTFPCLQILCLQYLGELCRIGDPTLTFPSLELLQVWECPKLERLPFRSQNMPGKLRTIRCSEGWWNKLEWEDEYIKSSLQPYVISSRQRGFFNFYSTLEHPRLRTPPVSLMDLILEWLG